MPTTTACFLFRLNIERVPGIRFVEDQGRLSVRRQSPRLRCRSTPVTAATSCWSGSAGPLAMASVPQKEGLLSLWLLTCLRKRLGKGSVLQQPAIDEIKKSN